MASHLLSLEMNTFAETGLRKEIIASLDKLGFEKPSPIQEQCIPHLLKSKQDIVALAPTGTGKTAAFSLPILHSLDQESQAIQAIILCPTRELCLQITKDIAVFSQFMGHVSTLAVYGGERIDIQLRALKKNPTIVVGTPGRVLDLIKRRKLQLQDIQWLVLDEADEMLNMGFKEDMDAILEQTPSSKQTLLFSATMPKSVATIAKKYMTNPFEIRIKGTNQSAKNIEHHYYMVHARDRFEALRRIVDATPDIYGIIFCRTKRETQEVADKLAQHRYSAEPLHGDIVQEQRTLIMDRFRKRHIQLLVATDVAARGIDVDELTHVINYNIPDNPETYIHRSGRTGRAGNAGISLSIVNMREGRQLRDIERKVGKPFEQKQVPSGKDICKQQMYSLINKVAEINVDKEEITPFLEAIYKKFEHLSREEVIQHFISVEFNRFLGLYKNAPDLNAIEDRRGDHRQGGHDFAKFKLSIGSRDGLTKKDILGLLNGNRSLQGVKIGKIDLVEHATYFEVDKNFAKETEAVFAGSSFQGKNITITPMKSDGGAGRSRRRQGGGYRGGHRRSSQGGGGRRDFKGQRRR